MGKVRWVFRQEVGVVIIVAKNSIAACIELSVTRCR